MILCHVAAINLIIQEEIYRFFAAGKEKKEEDAECGNLVGMEEKFDFGLLTKEFL